MLRIDCGRRLVIVVIGKDVDAFSEVLEWEDGDDDEKSLSIPLNDSTDYALTKQFTVTLAALTTGEYKGWSKPTLAASAITVKIANDTATKSFATFAKEATSGGVTAKSTKGSWFVDEDGNRLGMHKGITHYTVGQRKGLGIALGRPVYVKEIRPAADEVVLSDEPALFHRTVLCRDVNFLSIPGLEPGQTLRARSKVRYHHAAADSELQMLEDGTLRIHFDAPVRAPAPGQTAVFYDDDDCLIGGGFIL